VPPFGCKAIPCFAFPFLVPPRFPGQNELIQFLKAVCCFYIVDKLRVKKLINKRLSALSTGKKKVVDDVSEIINQGVFFEPGTQPPPKISGTDKPPAYFMFRIVKHKPMKVIRLNRMIGY
jgi:hypothetical protein